VSGAGGGEVGQASGFFGVGVESIAGRCVFVIGAGELPRCCGKSADTGCRVMLRQKVCRDVLPRWRDG